MTSFFSFLWKKVVPFQMVHIHSFSFTFFHSALFSLLFSCYIIKFMTHIFPFFSFWLFFLNSHSYPTPSLPFLFSSTLSILFPVLILSFISCSFSFAFLTYSFSSRLYCSSHSYPSLTFSFLYCKICFSPLLDSSLPKYVDSLNRQRR